MIRPQHSPARDAAWGRFFARRGPVDTILAGTQPRTPAERLAQWTLRYRSTPLELQLPEARR